MTRERGIASRLAGSLLLYINLGESWMPDPDIKPKLRAHSIIQGAGDVNRVFLPRGADGSVYEVDRAREVFAGGAAPTLTPRTQEMDLYRNDRTGGAAVTDNEDGFVAAPNGRKFFNGGGSTELDAGTLDPRRGVTIGVTNWALAGETASDQPGGAGPLADQSQQLVGLGGTYAFEISPQSLGVSLEAYFPSGDDPQLRLVGAGVPSSPVIVATGQTALADISRVVMRVQGVGQELSVAIFVGATRVDDGTIVLPRAAFDFDRVDGQLVSFGDINRSDGGFGQCALWTRALSDEEIGQLGHIGAWDDPEEGETEPRASYTTDNMDTVDGSGHSSGGDEGSGDLLIDQFGRSRLNPTTIRRVAHSEATLATEGPNRHRRSAAGWTPRAWLLTWIGGSKDYATVVAALDGTRGGALATRWRGPDDPPGNVDEAPKWFIRRADGEPGFDANRTQGGHRGRFSIVLEEAEL